VSNILEEIRLLQIYVNNTFFNEFTVKLDKNAEDVVHSLANKNILGGVPFSRLSKAGPKDTLLICATEIVDEHDIEFLCNALEEELR